ncbi:PD-(D/E)XK motif protein [Propionibacteriaceae bacterium Y1923]
MIRDEVRSTWDRIAEDQHNESGLLARQLPDHPSMMLATGRDGGFHLLLPAHGEVPTKSYGALRLGARELVDGERTTTFMDLWCEDQRLREAFFWLVSDIVERTERVGVTPDALVSILEEFKSLFSADRGMTKADLVGLVGELEVLELLAASHPGWQVLDWWVREEQDFRSDRLAVEVKSTEAISGGTITVNGLAQFATEQPLYLVVVECADGGSEDTVDARVERLVAAGVPRLELEAKVREVYQPDSPLAQLGVKPANTSWWRVDDNFPFLQSQDLPEAKRSAISRLTYSVPVASFPSENTVNPQDVLNGF